MVVNETLLVDGITWKIEIQLKNVYRDYAFICNNVDRRITSFEDCIQQMIIRDYEDYLTTYSHELCGKAPYRVFAFALHQHDDRINTRMSCYIECVDKYRLVEERIYEQLLNPSVREAIRSPAVDSPMKMEKRID